MKEKIKTYIQAIKKYGFKAISKILLFMGKLAVALFVLVSLFLTWLVIEYEFASIDCIKQCQEERITTNCNDHCY